MQLLLYQWIKSYSHIAEKHSKVIYFHLNNIQGFGYCVFGSVEEATNAVNSGGVSLQGRQLRLDFANERKPADDNKRQRY